MGNDTRSAGTTTAEPSDRMADIRAQVLFGHFEQEVRAMGLERTADRLRCQWWDARSRWAHGEAER